MSGMLSFRDVSAYAEAYAMGYRGGQKFPAFWTMVNTKDSGGPKEDSNRILKHINDITQLLLEWRFPITKVQRFNSALYRGRHYFNHEESLQVPYIRTRKIDKNHAKIVLPYLMQAADKHVEALTAYEPNIEVTPGNDDESAKVDSRMNKQLLDYYLYLYDLKVAYQRFHHLKKVQGEVFQFVEWDPDLGDYHPKYKELLKMRQDSGQAVSDPVPVVDPETGIQLTGTDNELLFINKGIHVGQTIVRLEYSERVLYPCPESYHWDDVPYIINLQWWPIDEAKARWPKYSEDIRADGMYRNYMGPAFRSLENKVCVRFLYHKPSRYLDRGYYCYSTESTMLESGEKLYNHDMLPVVRGTDLDLEYEITGMSFFQSLAPLSYAINNSTSMILQNQSLFAYPKYASPRGAKVRYTDMGDDRGIYEYSGPKGPELITNNSTPPDVWKWRDAMRDEFKTFSNIFAPSRGETPKGITANVALRMIDEEERKSHKPAIDKHGQNVILLGTLILATEGTYRDPADGFLIKVLGKNNARYLKYFDGTSLASPCEVRLARSSGLPENPAAKTQTVLDLADRFDGLWSPDEVLEYLDIRRPEKLIESATVARQAAESEVEDILAGVPNVPPPTPYHDLLPKYKVYERAMQSRAFDEADPMIKARMVDQIITAEYLMFRKMKINPAFEQALFARFPNFPMFFPLMQTDSQPFQLAQPQLPPGAMGMPQGADMAVPPPGISPPLGGIPPNIAASAPMPPPPQSAPGRGSLPPPGSVPLPGQPPPQQIPSAPGGLP